MPPRESWRLLTTGSCSLGGYGHQFMAKAFSLFWQLLWNTSRVLLPAELQSIEKRIPREVRKQQWTVDFFTFLWHRHTETCLKHITCIDNTIINNYVCQKWPYYWVSDRHIENMTTICQHLIVNINVIHVRRLFKARCFSPELVQPFL